MTDDSIMLVVKAHKEGKQIQMKPRPDAAIRVSADIGWVSLDRPPEWDFVNLDYRVKPELREWRVCITKDNPSRVFPAEYADTDEEIVLVREVLP